MSFEYLQYLEPVGLLEAEEQTKTKLNEIPLLENESNQSKPGHVASSVIKRLGTGSEDNLYKFAKLVMEIESDGNRYAKNPDSSATGYYQYVDNSVQPAINRTKRFFKGNTPEWLIELEKHRDVTKLSKDEYTQLFLADLAQKKGSDKYLKKAVEGDLEAMKSLYKEFHHTKPDSRTEARLNSIIKRLGY